MADTKPDDPLIKVEVAAEPANENAGHTTAIETSATAKTAEFDQPAEATNTGAKVAETEIIRDKPKLLSLPDGTDNNPPGHIPQWQTKIWGGVALGLGLCSFLLICLVGYSVYSTATIITDKSGADLSFTFAGLTLLNTTLLRLLSMLIGSGIIFGGLAVSFFSSGDSTKISLQAKETAGDTFKALVASNTPGIVGIFIGGVIIVATLYSKGEYNYTSPERYTYYPGAKQNSSIPQVEVTEIPSVEDAKKARATPPADTTNADKTNEYK
ncbi:hypothetical protein JFT81_08440 [Pseudomonas sp. TH43]|uniref:hypothetical protein n=1 Tax=Pseudomonas sp. TH43 TaxID=2796407 RepID=UPI0019113E64|nr:hypothetical protein [Pseudomonas sp. TH43]MBK5374661.1 hypothetical protein [Pseudomonas sp. TH43]